MRRAHSRDDARFYSEESPRLLSKAPNVGFHSRIFGSCKPPRSVLLPLSACPGGISEIRPEVVALTSASELAKFAELSGVGDFFFLLPRRGKSSRVTRAGFHLGISADASNTTPARSVHSRIFALDRRRTETPPRLLLATALLSPFTQFSHPHFGDAEPESTSPHEIYSPEFEARQRRSRRVLTR